MSEETKKILNLIFNLSVEAKLLGIGTLKYSFLEQSRNITVEEIQREFPTFKPPELPVYREIEPIGL